MRKGHRSACHRSVGVWVLVGILNAVTACPSISSLCLLHLYLCACSLHNFNLIALRLDQPRAAVHFEACTDARSPIFSDRCPALCDAVGCLGQASLLQLLRTPTASRSRSAEQDFQASLDTLIGILLAALQSNTACVDAKALSG